MWSFPHSRLVNRAQTPPKRKRGSFRLHGDTKREDDDVLRNSSRSSRVWRSGGELAVNQRQLNITTRKQKRDLEEKTPVVGRVQD